MCSLHCVPFAQLFLFVTTIARKRVVGEISEGSSKHEMKGVTLHSFFTSNYGLNVQIAYLGACYYKFWKGAGRRLSDFDVVGKSKLVNGLKHSTCLRTPLTSLLLHASPQTLQPPWASLRLTASGASCRAALPACLLTRSRALHFCASCMPSPRPSYPSRLWYGQQSTYFGGGAPFTREKAANKGMHWPRRCTHSANTMPLPLQTSNCAPESAGRPSSTTSTWSPCRHARARHYMSPQPGNALCQAASKARIAKTGEVAQAHGRSPNGSCEPRQRHWRRQGKRQAQPPKEGRGN